MSRYGALAFSQQTGRQGYAWGGQTPDEVRRLALQHCPQADAQILATVENGWLAVAAGPSGHLTWVHAETAESARGQALVHCRVRDPLPALQWCIDVADGTSGALPGAEGDNIDCFWLDDNDLARISRCSPSTDFGRAMAVRWPEHFREVCPREVYRGYAIGLWAVHAHLRPGISTNEIVYVCGCAARAVQRSSRLSGTDLLGGVQLAVCNAELRATCGVTASQAVSACESELIYAARMFFTAQQQGL